MLHLLLNWMPSLMVAKGFTKPQSFLIQIIFNLSSAGGAVALGWLMQRRRSRALLFVCYAGLAASLLIVASLGHSERPRPQPPAVTIYPRARRGTVPLGRGHRRGLDVHPVPEAAADRLDRLAPGGGRRR